MFVLIDLSKKCETLLDFREVGSMAYLWVFRIKIFWNDFKFIVFFTASYFFLIEVKINLLSAMRLI